jgi:hypothetical protein
VGGDEIRVTIPTGDRGMVGRECPACDQYFKLKPGTGLATTTCVCPYCAHSAESDQFFTSDQIDYAQSVALREIQEHVIGPMMRKIDRDLHRSSRNSMIKLSLRYRSSDIPIDQYSEQDLETDVTCATCSLEYAVFTVFATCPDCGDPNALDVFIASIDVATKRLHLADAVDDVALRDDLIADAVGSGVSAFDTLGKELRRRYASIIPMKPKNPFQNLDVVAKVLGWDLNAGPFGDLDRCERDHLKLMFQVRHIFEHNGGVVDDAFCRAVPEMNHLIGRRYPLNRSDANALLRLLPGLGRKTVSRVQALVDGNN